MNDSGWDKIVDAIDERFGIDRHGRTEAPLEDRSDLTQTTAFIEFTRQSQKYRVERLTRPAIADKRSIYHKAASGGIRYENVYDPAAVTHQTKFFRLQDGLWTEIDASELAL